MSTPSAESCPDAPNPPRNRLAYESLVEEARLMPAEKLVHITVTIPQATSAVLERLPKIREIRPAIVADCPFHNFALIDGLEDRARALRYAEALHQTVIEPPPPTSVPAAELRRQLKYWAPQLALWVARGYLPAAVGDAVKYTPSHRKLAANTIAIVLHLRKAWTEVSGTTGMTIADVDALEGAAEALDVLIAERDSRAKASSETADMRNRMFTLLDIALAELYRALHYVANDRIAEYQPPVYGEHANKARERGGELAPPEGTGEKKPST